MSTDARLQRMIEILIGQSDLTQYFHVDERPERLPLTVAVENPSRFSGGVAFGKPLAFTATGDDKALQLKVSEAGGETRIDFTYPPEGIAGHALFTGNDEPKLKSVSIVEQ